MDLGLRSRAALVTASSKGMGRAIALALAAEGCDVAMSARGADALEEARSAVAAHGTRVHATAGDLADPAQAAAMVEAAVEALGHLDILVVNAGGPKAGTFATLDDADWEEAVGLTLMSAVRLVRAALPALRRSDAASITLVSSYSIKQPIPDLVASNSIRLAVAGLAKSLSIELAPGVRVNTLLPGAITTERNVELARRVAARSGISVEEQLERVAATIPLGRRGSPKEFAAVAAFVASPVASYLTGQVIAVDGGLVRFPL